MPGEQSVRSGAGLMVLAALLFLVYAVVFFFRAFASGGFEVGVPTLNGVTPQQLDELNPAIMAYITHLHVAIAGFVAASAIACRRFGRGVADALHGTFPLRLGEPPGTDLRRYHHLCHRRRRSARRVGPSGADSSTSRSVDRGQLLDGYSAPSKSVRRHIALGHAADTLKKIKAEY